MSLNYPIEVKNSMRIRATRNQFLPIDMLNPYKTSRGDTLLNSRCSSLLAVPPYAADYLTYSNHRGAPYGNLFFDQFKSTRWSNPLGSYSADLLITTHDDRYHPLAYFPFGFIF
jgi:hypothetical protein